MKSVRVETSWEVITDRAAFDLGDEGWLSLHEFLDSNQRLWVWDTWDGWRLDGDRLWVRKVW